MNAYWTYTRSLPAYESVYYGGDYLGSVYADDVVYASIVIAETRGQAKSLFLSHYRDLGYMTANFEYVDVAAAYVIEKDVDHPGGVYDDCPEYPHLDPLWNRVMSHFWSEKSVNDYWEWVKEYPPKEVIS